MPTLFNPDDLTTTRENGASTTTLANASVLGVDALAVERITLDANMCTSVFEANNAERFIYIIRGAGQAHVGKEIYPLEPESILWIEPGDSYSLEAGEKSLEVLICRAPGN